MTTKSNTKGLKHIDTTKQDYHNIRLNTLLNKLHKGKPSTIKELTSIN